MTARWTATQLRRDLSARAERFARTHNLLHDLSTGASPTVLFGRDEHGRHGNFHPDSYPCICANPDWLQRLTKVHTASRRSRARKDWRWMELDSACSSDALLMNIFCHPGVFDGATLAAPVAALLGVDRTAAPCFGLRPGVPLQARKPGASSKLRLGGNAEPVDRTEIDLTLADPTTTLYLEAKLTESGFQTAPPALIARYRDLEVVFDLARLPHIVRVPHPSFAWVGMDNGRVPHSSQFDPSSTSARVPHSSQSHRDEWDVNLSPNPEPDFPDDSFLNLPNPTPKPRIAGYQLIRNVLAAYAANASFCVLSDARRHDLIETWYTVLSAVHSPAFTPRLKLLTWQELAATLPPNLQHFLDTRYGIIPT